jgi:hypothetical protein
MYFNKPVGRGVGETRKIAVMIEMEDVVEQEQRIIDWRRHGLSPRQGAARYYWMNRCPLYPPKADMCGATRDVRFGPILLQKSAMTGAWRLARTYSS